MQPLAKLSSIFTQLVCKLDFLFHSFPSSWMNRQIGVFYSCFCCFIPFISLTDILGIFRSRSLPRFLKNPHTIFLSLLLASFSLLINTHYFSADFSSPLFILLCLVVNYSSFPKSNSLSLFHFWKD